MTTQTGMIETLDRIIRIVSLAAGMASGLLPARQASCLDPVLALAAE